MLGRSPHSIPLSNENPNPMKLDDSRCDSSPSAPKTPHVLIPLLFGSIALHLLVWWAVAQFPAPPATVPETLTEVQLSDFPAPPVTVPKPQAARTVRPEPPRLAKAPRAPRRTQLAPPNPPRPERREIAPTAPLVRSERAVSETGLVAKKPVSKKPVVPLPTAAPRVKDPVPRPQNAPNATRPQPQNPKPQNPKPATETPSDKSSPLPNAGESQKSKASGSTDSSRSSEDVSKKGKGTGSEDASVSSDADGATSSSGGDGLFGLGRGPFGIGNGTGEGPRRDKTQFDKPSPLANAGTGQGQRSGKSKGSSAGNGSGAGDKSGASGGPFGVGGRAGGVAGEGPRRIVYILDISYSMEPRFERAKRELRDALSGLQEGESFNIIAVYGNVLPFEPRLVDVTPRNIAKGRAFIDSLRLSRYTNLERAFERAFAAPGVNVVVLITDGVPTYGLGAPDFSESDNPAIKTDISANFGELARRVRQLNRADARIYTVGLTGKNPNRADDSFEAAGLLQRIATESGGTFVTVRIDATAQPDAP